MENWQMVEGFEGRYGVSDQGRVRSVPHVVRMVSKKGRECLRTAPGKVLAAGRSRGYLIVNLSGFGTVAVHILVARAFVAGHFDGAEVNHKNGVKTFNSAGNLEWVTKAQNQRHSVDTGLKKQCIAVICPPTGVAYPSITRAARIAKRSHRVISATWSRV